MPKYSSTELRMLLEIGVRRQEGQTYSRIASSRSALVPLFKEFFDATYPSRTIATTKELHEVSALRKQYAGRNTYTVPIVKMNRTPSFLARDMTNERMLGSGSAMIAASEAILSAPLATMTVCGSKHLMFAYSAGFVGRCQL